MRKISVVCLAVVFMFVFALSLSARAFKSQSIGGATGLIATPTGHVGWEDSDLAFDLGYHYIEDKDNFDNNTSIPKFSFTLFKKFEIGGTYDMQPDDADDKNNKDALLHGKFQFHDGGGKSAVAIGGNYQMLEDSDIGYKAYQAYLAASYSGTFISDMSAETTIVIGKHWGDRKVVNKKDIDFSMGFDLDLLPSVFHGYVHWINDFSNYSYSKQAYGSNTDYRGSFNTGARISLMPGESRIKLNIDAILTDAFDANRGFTIGGTFGMAL
jgi:hypothetical protein